MDDELGCENYEPHHVSVECATDEFKCVTSGMCIPMVDVCNGVEDCFDGSDEKIGCSEIKSKCHGFLCANSRCITDKTWLCDGSNDCGDNSDELHCRKYRKKYEKYVRHFVLKSRLSRNFLLFRFVCRCTISRHFVSNANKNFITFI